MKIVLLFVTMLVSVQLVATDALGFVQDDARNLLKRWQSLSKEVTSLEYKGVLKGNVATTPKGNVRSHDRHFKGMAGYRLLRLVHDGDFFSSKIKDGTVCITPDFAATFMEFNRLYEFTNSHKTIESNPKLEYAMFDFFSVAIGWHPEADPSIGSPTIDSYWPFVLVRDALRDNDTEIVYKDSSSEGVFVSFSGKEHWIEFEFRRNQHVPYRITQNFSGLPQKLVGASCVEFYFYDFKQIETVCLPSKVERKIFRSKNEPPVSIATLTISELLINHLTKQDFQIHKPPGTYTINFDTNEVYSNPGGLDLLSAVLKQSLELTVRTKTRKVGAIKIAILLLSACLFLGALIINCSCRNLDEEKRKCA